MKSFVTILITTTSLLCSGCHLTARSPYKNRVKFIDGLRYSSASEEGNGFDLYLPAGVTGPVPAAIFIHGGYWRNQSRSYYRAFTGLYENFGLALSNRGIAAMVIDYRLSPETDIYGQYSDIEAAVKHLKAHAAEWKIDAERVCLIGHSAGGHLALMAAWQRGVGVHCVIALSPILDIAHMRRSKSAEFNRELTTPHFGDGRMDAEHSPMRYVSDKSTPALLFFGSGDDDYLREQEAMMLERVAELKLSQIRVESLPGYDHSDMVLRVNSKNDVITDRMALAINGQDMKGSPR